MSADDDGLPPRIAAADEPRSRGDASSERAEALALIEQWHRESPSTRRSARSVAIRDVVATYVHAVEVTRVAETRGVSPTQSTPARWQDGVQAEPDPWAVHALDLPDDASIGETRARVLPDAPALLSPCAACVRGRVVCSRCEGRGQIWQRTHQHTGHDVTCPHCRGSASEPCTACDGMGGFTGAPMAWSKIVATTTTRFVGAPGLETAAVLDVDPALPMAPSILRVDPWRPDAAPAGSYRDAHASPFEEHARALVAEQDASHRSRVRSSRLVVRRMGAYRVTCTDGKTFHVWGPPAKVSPLDALDAPSRGWLRWVGAALVAVIVLGVAWVFAGR